MGKLKKQLSPKSSKKADITKEKGIKKPSLLGKKTLKEKIQKRIGTGLIKNKPAKKVKEENVEPSKAHIKKKTPKKTAKTNNYSLLETKYKVQANTVESAFQSVIKLIKLDNEKKNMLFEDEQPIFLQICAMKVPKCPKRILRIPLKHSLYGESSEVCLIVPDLKDIRNKETERVAEHYEEILKSKGVENIKKIMPYYELRTEYGGFELKRRLVDLYDVFLVDGKISGYVVHKLGKIFYGKRKVPIPIKIESSKLKESIETALKKTHLLLHSNSDSYIVQIGHSNMKNDEIIDNVFALVEGLEKEFPGGWENIRNLHLKGPRTQSLPVYITLKPKSMVKVPKVEPKRPKLYKEVSGEISTKLNSNVTVLPSGEVIVSMINEKFPSTRTSGKDKKNVGDDVDLENSDDDDEEAENNEDEEKEIKASEKNKKGKKVKRNLKKTQENGEKTKGNKKAKKMKSN